MFQNMTTLLLLLGLFSKTSCYFLLIQDPKTWTEAQSFCKELHGGLATVQSDQDESKIQEITSSMSFNRSWMGLYVDVNSWSWSFQNQHLEFQNWRWEDPSYTYPRKCGMTDYYTFWRTDYCEEEKPFFCYTGKDSTDKFVVIKTTLKWRDAQHYCRINHIDLATISDYNDNSIVFGLILKNFFFNIKFEGWIGLSKNLWLWSDQSKVNWTSLKWAPGEPDNGSGNEKCAFVQDNGLIGDEECSQPLPFFCAKHRIKQLVRVAVTSAGRLNESAVMAAVEEKIKQILTEQKMDAGSGVTWQVQADGEIFHRHKKPDMKEDPLLPFCPKDH